MQSMIRWRKA